MYCADTRIEYINIYILKIEKLILCVGVLPACMPVHHMHAVPVMPEKILEPLELELQVVMRRVASVLNH